VRDCGCAGGEEEGEECVDVDVRSVDCCKGRDEERVDGSVEGW